MATKEKIGSQALSLTLGTLLNDPDRFPDVASRMLPEDVLEEKERLIYQAMWDAAHEGRCDIVSTVRLLKKRGQLDEAGGADYLSGLTAGVPRGVDIDTLVRSVIEDSWNQRIVLACEEGIAEVEAGAQPDEVTKAIERKLFELHAATAKNPISSSSSGAADILLDTVEAAEGTGRLPVPTGFGGIDAVIDGFYPGELIILGARPSIGKSSLALDFSYNAALAGKRAAFFSCEMESVRVWRRLVSKMSLIDSSRIRRGQLSPEEWSIYASSILKMRELPLFVDDTSGITPGEIRAKCRRLQMDGGLDLVVIDYAHIMTPGMPGIDNLYNQNAELTFISKMVKDMARELDLPVVLLSQLNRKPEDRRAGRPLLSDLRGSGSLEQDADTIMFVHREDQVDPTEKNIGHAEITIAKSRDGGTGVADATFIRHLSTYVNSRLRTSKRAA